MPALTPVQLVIDSAMGSKLSTTGAMFPLHLAKPITIAGVDVIPAGTTGQGEVIWAKKAGGGGSAGELVLAVRFLDVAGRRLKLRSLRLGGAGVDSIRTVDTVNAAAVASPIPLGFAGFLVTGRNILFPAGTIADAKTAEEFSFDPVGVTNPQEEPVAAPAAPKAEQ